MLYELIYFLSLVLVIPLLPLLAWDAVQTRKRVGIYPAAKHPKGIVDGGPQTLTILTIGESTMAGWGIPEHVDSFTGQCAQLLAKRLHKTVHWEVLARHGLTAQDARKEYLHRIAPVDLIFIGLGASDAFSCHSPLTFKRAIQRLIKDLQKKYPHAILVFMNVPPIAQFPAFPLSLRLTVGSLAKAYHSILLSLHDPQKKIFYSSAKFDLTEAKRRMGQEHTLEDFFVDGVHPSKLCNRLWAEELDAFLCKNVW